MDLPWFLCWLTDGSQKNTNLRTSLVVVATVQIAGANEGVRKAKQTGRAGTAFVLVRFGFRVRVAGAQANFQRRILWQHHFSSARQKI